MLNLKRAALFLFLVLSFISPAHAQEDFVIKVGENKEFREFNYHDLSPTGYGNTAEVVSEGNTASVNALASIPFFDGHTGKEWEESYGAAAIGLKYTLDLKGYDLSEVADWPVKVTVNFNYGLEFKSSPGTGGAAVSLEFGFFSFQKAVNSDESSEINEKENLVLSSETTVGDLYSFQGTIPFYFFIDAIAQTRFNAPFPNYARSQVTINSIIVEFPTINQPPLASFTYSPQNPKAGEQITFDASSSSDPDGTITKYLWSFGDGATAEGVTVTHTYTTAGTYTVTLTVTDDKGLQNSTAQSPVITAPLATDLTKQAEPGKIKTVGEPINVSNGNMFTSLSEVSIPSGKLSLELSLTYNSQDDFQGSFGYGWRSNFDITLSEQPDQSVIEVDETGVYTIYTKNADNSYTPSAGKYSVLTKNLDSSFQILRKHGNKLYFNSSGLLTSIEDRNANSITIQRSSSGVIQEVTDSSARKLLFASGSQGQITQVTDPAGRTFKYEYDSNGNLVKFIDPLNQATLYAYDSNHNLIQLTDPNSHSLYFEYDSSDRAYRSFQDNHNNEVTLSFDTANKTTTLTNSLGNTTKYEYNDYGLVTKITDPQNNIQTFVWDNNLNKTSITNQNGFNTLFTYDQRGNLLTTTDALNNTTLLSYETNFDFIASATDALGNTTTYSYDPKGNLIQTKDALNNITTYSYTTEGLLNQLKDANNNLTLFTYDSFGNLTQITDSLNNVTGFSYDILGNKTQTTDSLGSTTTFTYDLLNRLTQITYADNSKVTYSYDPVGNLISSTDQNNNTTGYAYDVADRLTQATDAQGNTTTFTYDTEGNRIQVTDSQGNTTAYTYDSLNRLIRTQDPLNNQTLFSYDPAGNLISKTDPNGNTIYYTYDALNRLIKKQYPDQTEEAFAYDAKGTLLTAANSNISYNFTYDSLGQLLKVTDSNNRSISYAYDAVGNKTKITTPEGKAVNYSYDLLNRLTSILDTYNKTTNYTYDSLSRRTKVTLPNQTTTLYTYDSLNNLLNLVNKAKNNEVISSYNYTYDLVGNRLTKTEPDLKTSYTYDSLYRLTQATPVKAKNNGQEKEKKNQLETYTYDSVGNRLTSRKNAYSYNTLNQLLTTNNYTYQYDKNGNLTKKTEIDEKDNKTKASTFTYDYENRLIKVEIQKENRLKVVSFTYDPFGRRLSKTIQREEIEDENNEEDNAEDTPDEKTLPRTTYYVYDSEDIILEYNQKGKITARYTHGPGIDEPISIEKGLSPKGTVPELYYYHYDGLGSVTELTDQKGKTVESYSYDSFGNLKRKGNKTKNTFTYTAREYDRETGLYYYRARYYDAKIGRFLSQDPLGMVDGPNLYSYVGNNAVNFVDPWGLCGISKDVRKRIEEEIKIRQMYIDYLEGRRPYPTFKEEEILARPVPFTGVILYTPKGQKVPQWQKKYDIEPHEKTHFKQQWSSGWAPILFTNKSPEIKTEEFKKWTAKGEIEAYDVSIQSMENYLKTLEKR